MVRLTAELWVEANLTRLRLADIPAYVVAKGDVTAGAVLDEQAPLDGSATLYQLSIDFMTRNRAWVVLAAGPEPEVDAAIERQRSFDPICG